MGLKITIELSAKELDIMKQEALVVGELILRNKKYNLIASLEEKGLREL